LFDVVSGSVKMQNVLGTALIEINHQIMPTWQMILKRVIDLVVSMLVLVILLPLYLLLAIAVKATSEGPVFFKQTRIGLHGKPFSIIKYRTMVVNAEANGPALSSKEDKRITSIGRTLRKYRLDEIPQFYNVLVGDMSLVGPRPERQFFIDQIMPVAPHYKHLQRVRPGITSWGMVKYGYAENIGQMIERLKFDILYIENMSLAMDFRIMIYTVKTIIQGRGK
jgi:exopolysaccharide biosynthesis polyprenyl glycosylphosphotransferase